MVGAVVPRASLELEENAAAFQVAVILLSKNFVFPTICVLTSQNTSRPKVPIRKLSPSRSIKTEVHAPGFYEIAPQFLFYARCRAYVLIFSNSRPFGRLFLYLYAFSLTFSGLPPRAGPERISAIFR